MIGVDDARAWRAASRHVVGSGRDAAQHAGLGHVRMNDRRPRPIQFAIETPQGADIGDRRQRAAQGFEVDRARAGCDQVTHVAFAVAEPAVDQRGRKAVRLEPVGEARRLNRRAADVQARDDAHYGNRRRRRLARRSDRREGWARLASSRECLLYHPVDGRAMMLGRRKKLVFALLAMSLSIVGALVLLLVADLVLHYRAERSAGLNRYGYRGPVVPRKQPGELRVVMLGGSTVFGYGVSWNESIPSQLEPRLQQRLGRPVKVVNLGFNNEGAFAFVPNLEDFEYLDYDVIVLYEGYNDLPGDEGPNRSVYRRDSAVFRAVGYYPILPLYLDGEGDDAALRQRSQRGVRRRRALETKIKQVVFRPGLAKRTSAGALEAVAHDDQGARRPAPEDRNGPAAGDRRAPVDARLRLSVRDLLRIGGRGGAVRARSRQGAWWSGRSRRAAGRRSEESCTRSQHADAERRCSRGRSARDRRVAYAGFVGPARSAECRVTFDGMHLKPEANALGGGRPRGSGRQGRRQRIQR